MAKFLKKDKVHDPYFTKDGKRAVAVSTILYEVRKPALEHWKWQMGMEGIDYKSHTNTLGDIGSLAHDMILCHFKKKKCDTSEYSKQQIILAENAMLSFYAWERSNEIKTIFVEEKLVSERFHFGGKPDWFGKINGKLTLVDFKTGKRLYDDIFYQLAAYGMLIREVKGYTPEEYLGVNIPRADSERFAIARRKEIFRDEMIFISYMSIYRMKQLIERESNTP